MLTGLKMLFSLDIASMSARCLGSQVTFDIENRNVRNNFERSILIWKDWLRKNDGYLEIFFLLLQKSFEEFGKVSCETKSCIFLPVVISMKLYIILIYGGLLVTLKLMSSLYKTRVIWKFTSPLIMHKTYLDPDQDRQKKWNTLKLGLCPYLVNANLCIAFLIRQTKKKNHIHYIIFMEQMKRLNNLKCNKKH